MGCIRNKQIVTRCTSPITHTHTHASYIKTFPFYTTKLILVNELKKKIILDNSHATQQQQTVRIERKLLFFFPFANSSFKKSKTRKSRKAEIYI